MMNCVTMFQLLIVQLPPFKHSYDGDMVASIYQSCKGWSLGSVN